MAFSTIAKNALNRLLAVGNLRIETLTHARVEERRLSRLAATGHFDRAVFPIPQGFLSDFADQLLLELPHYRARFDSFRDAATNDVGYTFENGYYGSPDAEVLYSMARKFKPHRVVEIGSGNSTRLFRQAIWDGKLDTYLTSIDPCPRTEISKMADQIYRMPVEEMPSHECFHELRPGDFLFIDSSHQLRPGSDCVFLFLRILPELAPGVIIHVHDVFLPYDYPPNWQEASTWTEQYALHAFLAGSTKAEVFWPAWHLVKSRPRLLDNFPHVSSKGLYASSFWWRMVAGPQEEKSNILPPQRFGTRQPGLDDENPA